LPFLAVQTGQKDDVQLMLSFLVKFWKRDPDVTPEILARQLEKDYGIPVQIGGAFPGFARPTEEELKWAFDIIRSNPPADHMTPA